jgi:hypothetical protein
MTQQQFKVGDKVKFKPEHEWYATLQDLPLSGTITGFDDNKITEGTCAYLDGGTYGQGTSLCRFELVTEEKPTFKIGDEIIVGENNEGASPRRGRILTVEEGTLTYNSLEPGAGRLGPWYVSPEFVTPAPAPAKPVRKYKVGDLVVYECDGSHWRIESIDEDSTFPYRVRHATTGEQDGFHDGCISGLAPTDVKYEECTPTPPTTKTEHQQRKDSPVARGVLDYFPDALMAVAAVSRVGNEQHNAGQPMHWAFGKSTDEADCIIRHLADRGTLDTDGLPHSGKVAWRALALLQRELELASPELHARRQAQRDEAATGGH